MRLLPLLLLLLNPSISVSNVRANVDPSQDLNTLSDNSLFTRWRPRFHVLPPAGWMNDPCSAQYDPTRDTYHLFYQFHPNHVDWGNISWGHATSHDLTTWSDVGGWRDGEPVAIGVGVDGSYDHLGVFSGTGQPVNLKGRADGNLTVFYTSVKHLPTAWNRDYIPGTESQSMATSSDGGITWQKYDGNPVLMDPPAGWDITGWRDPFLLPWPEMDTILQQNSPHYYTVFGSGIKGVGPRIPLYSSPASDLTNWTFLGALFEVGQNVSFGGDPTQTGNFGFNFEVPGAFSLHERGGETAHHFITTGTQGGESPSHPNPYPLWAEGDMTRRSNGSAQFDIVSSGLCDWGNLYAVTSFWDTKNRRRVSWGWSPEDMNGYGIKAQGFQGSMAFPREFFVHQVSSVLSPTTESLANLSSRWLAASNGTYTVTTLGIRPLPDVAEQLRASGRLHKVDDFFVTRSAPLVESRKGGTISAKYFQLQARLSNISGSVGFIVGASPALEESTVISYSSATSILTVHRDNSSLVKRFSTFPVNGRFKPYTISNQGLEVINIQIFGDGSLIEVFINDRFALTTRIYPTRDDAQTIWAYVCDKSSASFEGISVWTGLKSIWPGRPVNSSRKLITDGSEDTGNGTWWSGI